MVAEYKSSWKSTATGLGELEIKSLICQLTERGKIYLEELVSTVSPVLGV